MRELKTDILIVGGGVGGCAAALACARMGVACIMTEPTDWIGGQLTVQAVPPDENRWVETFGANRSYQDLREGVRRYYRQVRGGLTPEAATNAHLNPGGGWVSRLCAEPRIWHDVLAGILAGAGYAGVIGAPSRSERDEGATDGATWPLAKDPRTSLAVLLHHTPTAAEVVGDRVHAVKFTNAQTGNTLHIEADFILDATETGDLLELASVEHAIGAEHRDVYGELHGRDDFDIDAKTHEWIDQQPCSWCFAIEHRPGENYAASKPANYDWWRGHVPQMSPPWCGPLFSWTVPSHTAQGCRMLRMVPWPDEPTSGEWEMWRYRRIVDRSMYLPGQQAAHPDVTLINMVQMDYWQKPLLGVPVAEQAAALAGAREQSLCWLHWMQTEAPRHDGEGLGYPGLKLRGDELGTIDGFAKAAYIREPRRLIARTIVTEAHVGTEQRRAAGWDKRDSNWTRVQDAGAGLGTAEPFSDSVGIGHYMIDLHPTCAGRNNVYVPAAPFRIPMGSLIPVRVRNLLAAGKCLGVTHVTNGAYRMHAVEWSVGEAAGTLAAWCVCQGGGARRRAEPVDVHASPDGVRDVQRLLRDQGVRVTWPWE